MDLAGFELAPRYHINQHIFKFNNHLKPAMPHQRKTFGLLCTLVIIILASTTLVSACSCVMPGSPQQELNESDAVFAGTVENVADGIAGTGVGPTGLSRGIYVTFDVSTTWKGPQHKTLVIKTAAQGASCGYPFKEGNEYLVYANEEYGVENGKLTANLCSRTARLNEADTDLNALGSGITPTKGQNYVPRPVRYQQIAAATFLILLTALLYRRYR